MVIFPHLLKNPFILSRNKSRHCQPHSSCGQRASANFWPWVSPECRWGPPTEPCCVGSGASLASISKSSIMGPSPPRHWKERADMLDKLLIFSWRSCSIAHLSPRRRQLLTEPDGGESAHFQLWVLLGDLKEEDGGPGVHTGLFPTCSAMPPRLGRLSRDIIIGGVDEDVWRGVSSGPGKGEVFKNAEGQEPSLTGHGPLYLGLRTWRCYSRCIRNIVISHLVPLPDASYLFETLFRESHTSYIQHGLRTVPLVNESHQQRTWESQVSHAAF